MNTPVIIKMPGPEGGRNGGDTGRVKEVIRWIFCVYAAFNCSASHHNIQSCRKSSFSPAATPGCSTRPDRDPSRAP